MKIEDMRIGMKVRLVDSKKNRDMVENNGPSCEQPSVTETYEVCRIGRNIGGKGINVVSIETERWLLLDELTPEDIEPVKEKKQKKRKER